MVDGSGRGLAGGVALALLAAGLLHPFQLLGHLGLHGGVARAWIRASTAPVMRAQRAPRKG